MNRSPVFARLIEAVVVSALLALDASAAAADQPAAQRRYDVVLQQGRVIDPETGLDDIRSVGIEGDRITAISEEPLHGVIEIDATSLVVAPGFIDLHNHSPTPLGQRFQVRDAWDEAEAVKRHRRGLRLATEAGKDALCAAAWLGMARMETRRSDPRAHDHLALALELAERAEDDHVRASALTVRSRARVSSGDIDGALLDVEEAARLFAQYPDVSSTTTALNYEGLARIDAGQPERAAACAERSVRLSRQVGDVYQELHARSILGFALVLGDSADRAIVVLEEAAERADRNGLKGLQATLYGDLGIALGDLERPEALDRFETAASRFDAMGNHHSAVLYRRYAAAACALAGDVERARSMWVEKAEGTGEVAQLWGVIEPNPAVLAEEQLRWESGAADPDVRVATRWHARRVAAISPAVTVHRDGRVQLQDGTIVDLSRRHAPRRILLHLADRRIEVPGACATLDQLVSAGWPDERIVATAASNRAYVAVATLRKAGLATLLQSGPDGYRLDPGVPLRFA